MVTAWSNISTQDNVAHAHRLLGQAFNWLSRFPFIPDQHVQAGGLAPQLYAPPTLVAQMDSAKSAGELWHALGIQPRPYFNLIVTVWMDLQQSVEDAIVTTVSSNYLQAGIGAAAEELMMIGGTVRDSGGNPIADARSHRFARRLKRRSLTPPAALFLNGSRKARATHCALARAGIECLHGSCIR
jgi:hypothetical protein